MMALTDCATQHSQRRMSLLKMAQLLKCTNDNTANKAQHSENCWIEPLFGPIKRLCISSRDERIVPHLRTVDPQQSGASLLQRLWFFCCCQWESLLLFHTVQPLSLSLTKSYFISAAQVWKLMKRRDWLVLLALLETCVLRGRTLEPINLKWNPEPSLDISESC